MDSDVRRFLSRHAPWLTAIGLALAYFLVQLYSINAYGVTWDEPLHRNWGRIFATYLASGDRRILEMMPGHGIEYGPLYYWCNYLLSEWLYASGHLSFVASNHVLNLLTTSIGVGLVFLLAATIFDRRTGFFSVLFFALFPPLVAHAHYNPKDIPVMMATTLTALLFVRALKSGRRLDFVFAGAALGLAIALKINALLLLPALGLAYALSFHRSGSSLFSRSSLVTMLLVVLTMIVALILAWPSAWGDPSLILHSIRFFSGPDFWPGKVLYFGQEYAGAELPWYYSPLEYLSVMPTLFVVFFGIGGVSLVRRFGRDRKPEHLFLLLWILVPLLMSMKPRLVRYDGMRQFFFCLPALSSVASSGFARCLTAIKRSLHFHRYLHPYVAPALSVLLIASLVHEVAIIHPFEGSYRNEVIRTLVPKDMDHVFQVEYWGSTYRQGMDWLVANAAPRPIICVPTAGILVGWYPWRDDFTFDCSAATTYIMFFTRYSEVSQQFLSSITSPPVFTIERMGATLLKIYKVR
jgi:hypothetical protein